jgi:hypothetical protein
MPQTLISPEPPSPARLRRDSPDYAAAQPLFSSRPWIEKFLEMAENKEKRSSTKPPDSKEVQAIFEAALI